MIGRLQKGVLCSRTLQLTGKHYMLLIMAALPYTGLGYLNN